MVAEAGASLERVRRVHLHLLKLGNGCAAPVLSTVWTCVEDAIWGKNPNFKGFGAQSPLCSWICAS